MKCSLCGHAFSPDEGHRACQKCWLAKFCALVRCPNCGFEMPPMEEEHADAAAHAAWDVTGCVQAGWRNAPELRAEICANASVDSVTSQPSPMTALEPGRRATVARLDTSRREGLRQLLALGLLPDTEITLLRRFPTLVVQMGHSQFAIDRELAAMVFVHCH